MDHEDCIRRRKLPNGQFQAWDFTCDGHTVNGTDRLVGPLPKRGCVCEYPDCGGDVSEVVRVDRHVVLLCTKHFTPTDAVAAFVARVPVGV